MFVSSSATALFAYRNWNRHNDNISKSLMRLSSGKRINSAADDPAGLGISQRMKAQLAMIDKQQDNVSMNMSMIETADGIMGEMNNMLDRMLELANRAASGSLSDTDRKKLNEEYQQMMDEINRLGVGSTFNSVHLFQKQDSGSASGAVSPTEVYLLSEGDMQTYLNSLDAYLQDISSAAAGEDDQKLLSLGIDRLNGMSDDENLRLAVTEFTRRQAALLSSSSGSPDGAGPQYEVKVGGDGITVEMPKIDKKSLGLKDTSLLTQDGAREAMDAVKSAIDSIVSSRGSLGATYNRLQHTSNTLSIMEENLTEAMSRITDADMAKEMMKYVKEQVLAQAALFAMAQAVKKPEDVLYLIHSM